MSSLPPITPEQAIERCWDTIHACGGTDGLLRAAAGSALYPHVWTRDVGMAAMGILATHRDEQDVAPVVRSLELIAKHQDRLGRAPLKVDVCEDVPVLENSCGIDSSLWLTLSVDALKRFAPSHCSDVLVDAALRALHWAEHLDVNGDLLLETPEAGDWADMMPHRHNVLFVNVLYVAALRAAARLATGEEPRRLAKLAGMVANRIRTVFTVGPATDAAEAGEWLTRVAEINPEFGITGQYASRYGDLPFLLPYVAFRHVGTHCDVVGNLLAVVTGVLPRDQSQRLLQYLDDVGAAHPYPTKTMYPPFYPGDPDYRDHYRWRNLMLPFHYQNGGSWPFVGALHVCALQCAGMRAEAQVMLERLRVANLEGGKQEFPEWQHGVTGAAMGEGHQLWSASGLLLAMHAVRGGRDGIDENVWNPSP